ncbi:phage integrase family protein [Nonomuraea polychroma]|uniref:Phage integrase family protein n=1 Tax=Nonomuraea polychroma TaxID=46176 RepID=A0A438LXV8_9ACTN|nr:phage integrase family protein [Nonomuraea polychroma]
MLDRLRPRPRPRPRARSPPWAPTLPVATTSTRTPARCSSARWISDLSSRFGTSTVQTAFLVLQCVFSLAVADEVIKRSPAKSPVVQVPKRAAEEITAWSDERVSAAIDAHPELFRLLPIIGAACGLRQGELFGLALEDFDFEERVLRVHRQIKKLGSDHLYALPKNDRERVVPLPAWAAGAVKRHVSVYRPLVCSLPWEKLDGKPRTHNLLFRWTGDRHVRSRTHSEIVWKPALVQAGVIPLPDKDSRQRRRLHHLPQGGAAPAPPLLRERHAGRRRLSQRTRRASRPRRTRIHPPRLRPPDARLPRPRPQGHRTTACSVHARSLTEQGPEQ